MDPYTERIVGLERSITRWKRAGLVSLISASLATASFIADRIAYTLEDDSLVRNDYTMPTRHVVEFAGVAIFFGAALFCKIRKDRALSLVYGSPPEEHEWSD